MRVVRCAQCGSRRKPYATRLVEIMGEGFHPETGGLEVRDLDPVQRREVYFALSHCSDACTDAAIVRQAFQRGAG